MSERPPIRPGLLAVPRRADAALQTAYRASVFTNSLLHFRSIRTKTVWPPQDCLHARVVVCQTLGEPYVVAFKRALVAYNVVLRRNPGDVQSRVFSVVPLWRLGELKGKDGRKDLEAALAILKPLAAALDLTGKAGSRRAEEG